MRMVSVYLGYHSGEEKGVLPLVSHVLRKSPLFSPTVLSQYDTSEMLCMASSTYVIRTTFGRWFRKYNFLVPNWSDPEVRTLY